MTPMQISISALILGVFLFIHYGCAVLKHDANKSTPTIMLLLTAIMVAAVLTIRAAIRGLAYQVDITFDLSVALMLFGYAKSLLSLYLWSFGVSYLRSASEIYHAGGFRIKGFIQRIKDAL